MQIDNDSFTHVIGKKYGLLYAPEDTHFEEYDYMYNPDDYIRKKSSAGIESLVDIIFNMGYVYLFEHDKYGNVFELGYGIQGICDPTSAKSTARRIKIPPLKSPFRKKFVAYYESHF